MYRKNHKMLKGDEQTHTKFSINADFPLTEDNRVHHVGVKEGDVANNIITVGDVGRAWRLAELLDESKAELFSIKSSRGFLTITGHYKGLKVSVVAIGMGISMMDFFVREVAQVVNGNINIVRVGSCGSIRGDIPVGSIVLVEESAICTRNYDSFITEEDPTDNYNITEPIKACPKLFSRVSKLAHQHSNVVSGCNITADSFYSSQGRPSTEFDDRNDCIFSIIKEKIPHAISLEMETFMLYHLAKCSITNRINAFAVQIVFADRLNSDFINPKDISPIEYQAGKIILDSFI